LTSPRNEWLKVRGPPTSTTIGMILTFTDKVGREIFIAIKEFFLYFFFKSAYSGSQGKERLQKQKSAS